jgi:hypothetical protein
MVGIYRAPQIQASRAAVRAGRAPYPVKATSNQYVWFKLAAVPEPLDQAFDNVIDPAGFLQSPWKDKQPAGLLSLHETFCSINLGDH